MSDKGINDTGLARLVALIKANFARLSHTHAASDVTSGVFDSARIPVASSSGVGGIKVGTGLSIANDGTLSASGGGGSGGSASVMTGATDSSDGVEGLVPAPVTGEQDSVLFGDGDWSALTLDQTIVYGHRILSLKKGSTALSTETLGGSISLWTNDSPGSSFAAQTVTLRVAASGFDFLLFEYYYSNTGQQLQSQLVSANYTGTIGLRIVQAGSNRTGGRNCTVSGTTVTFEAASYNGGTNNNYCIPYRIIGIKL